MLPEKRIKTLKYRYTKIEKQFSDEPESCASLIRGILTLFSTISSYWEPFMGNSARVAGKSIGMREDVSSITIGKDAGYHVVGTYEDFFSFKAPPKGVEALISNIPFSFTKQIIDKLMGASFSRLPFAVLTTYGRASEMLDKYPGKLAIISMNYKLVFFHRRGIIQSSSLSNLNPCVWLVGNTDLSVFPSTVRPDIWADQFYNYDYAKEKVTTHFQNALKIVGDPEPNRNLRIQVKRKNLVKRQLIILSDSEDESDDDSDDDYLYRAGKRFRIY